MSKRRVVVTSNANKLNGTVLFQVSDHVNNTCPLTEVLCPYNWLGCISKVILDIHPLSPQYVLFTVPYFPVRSSTSSVLALRAAVWI